jgi:hypothetical protein
MPVSRKRKEKKKNTNIKKKIYKPYEVVKRNFISFENPFPEDIPFEKRLEIIIEIGNKSKDEYEKEYEKILSYFKEYDSLYLCSFCAYYFVRNEEGIDREAIDGHLDFPPFYLEILQCIALMSEKVISAKPLNEKIFDFESTIKKLNKSQSASYFKLAEKATSQEDVSAIMLRTEMMVHTLAIRNWAYIHQMNEITLELGNLVEPLFKDEIGFKPSHLLDLLTGIIELTEKKLNNHRKKTHSFITPKKYDDVFAKYEEAFPHVDKTDVAKREKIWSLVRKNLKNLKAMFLAHSDYFLSDVYSHSITEVSNHLSNKLSEIEVSNILNKLSYYLGELSAINKDFIFLDNPVHLKPFVRMNGEKYFSIIPHMFSHIALDILETFISQNSKINNQYTSVKGNYLEDKVEKLMRKSFPKAQIYKGSLWSRQDDVKLYENDLIVLIEEFAIIIECKSGTVSPPAKRGAPERLFKTMKELVVEPSEQAIRFQNFLKENPKLHELKTKSGTVNNIDSSKIRYYIPLGVTLSNLGSIGCNLKKLISAKIISHKLSELAPSISYTDLEIIFEILTTQAEKIHYLSRRREFEAHVNFQGDEMDLFGFYLDNGFNIGETEFDENFHIDLTLKSKELDPYFIGKHRNVEVEKPALQKTKYWSDLLSKIELNSQNWLVSSFILLNQPKEDQIKYEKKLKQLMHMVINDECEKKHNYLFMHFGPERRKYILVGYPYKDTDRQTRNGIINDIVSSINEQKNIKGYLIIGYDLDSSNYPYSVLVGSMKTNLFDKIDK